MSNRETSRGPLRSSIVTEGVDRATHRSLLYAMGWDLEHLRKPLVAVVNSFNELVPGHVTPEAYLGGTVNLDVPPDVLEARRQAWRPPEDTELERGSLLERYRRMVGTAMGGGEVRVASVGCVSELEFDGAKMATSW